MSRTVEATNRMNIPESYYIHKSELIDHWNRFSELVHKKTYKKLSYDLWKKFDNEIKNVNSAHAHYSYSSVTVTFTFPHSPSCYTFAMDDKSFGQFWYEHVMEENTKALMKKAQMSAAFTDIAVSAVSEATNAVSTLANTLSSYCDTSSSTNRSCYGTTYQLSDRYNTTIPDIQKTWGVDYTGTPYTVYCNGEWDINKEENKMEEKKMKGFNFDFGPVNSNVRMSIYGMAIKNKAGTYVSYNPATGDIMDVDVLNFEGSKFMYKMPVAIKDIAVGDIVIHQGAPCFVTNIPEDGKSLDVVDVFAGENKNIILTKSPFGFDFATKVVSFFGMVTGAAAADQPFGNMLPFLLAENGEVDPMVLMMLMGGGKMDFAANPMMLYFLAKDGGKSDMLPILWAMSQNK